VDTDISFELDQVLTQETRDGLNEFANAGLQAINYASFITQITSQISTLAVDSTIATLETTRDALVLISVSKHIGEGWSCKRVFVCIVWMCVYCVWVCVVCCAHVQVCVCACVRACVRACV